MIFLIVPVLQIDIYAKIMGTWCNFDASASELRADLVETTSRDAFFGTIHPERRDRRVMRCLFGKIRYFDGFVRSARIVHDGFFAGCSEY